MAEYDHVDGDRPEVRELSSRQRRVLGVLLEKAFTTPEYYPLTLKAVTAGCNQKSNRSPVVNYDEDAVEEVLDQLKEMGLVGVLHPDSGRSLRYRHYMRKRYEFTESQLAILTELLLRGRQAVGELRGRASRMVAIESLDELRNELGGLIKGGYCQSSGSLERRGIEVDHCFYKASDNQPPLVNTSSDDEPASRPAAPVTSSGSGVAHVAASGGGEVFASQVRELRQENQELRSELEALRGTVAELEAKVDQLCRDLGV
jgi:uncharacterized protein